MSALTSDLLADVAAVQRLESVPALLKLACEVTGLGFAVIARVTDDSWTACAVLDKIGLALQPGSQLDLDTTLCSEVRQSRAPIAFDHASTDPIYRIHPTPMLYGLESYISVPIVTPEGDYFGNLCALDRKPARVANEQTLLMFSFWADLIARQLREDAVHVRERQVAADERATGELREQFIAVLGHDLRNPLSAVTASTAMLERTVAAELRPAVARIRSSAARMAALIDDLLDFARGRLGAGLGIDVEEVDDLDAALGDVVGELQVAHPGRRLVFRSAAIAPIRCDRRRVQQLLSNLVGNAIAHGSPTGVVDIVAGSDESGFFLCVGNDGEPIAPANLAQVFDPFWRKESGPHRDGLGLGLYICAQIVKAHAGTISVFSTLESGTLFTVRFPFG